MVRGRISIEQVRHVAALASLELSDDESSRMCADLDRILGHFAELEEVSIEGVEPFFEVTAGDEGTRPDEVQASLSHDAALAAAPSVVDGAFAVPKIVEADR